MVELLDPEPNGLAEMVAGLIEANLRRHPARRSLLEPAVIALTAPDAGVSVTIGLAPGRVTVSNGEAAGRADLQVRADSTTLLDLAASPLRFGLPDVLTADGRRVVGKLLAGRVRIAGMIRHPGKLARLNKLLSVT
ncbi:MAG: hypothetical protein HYU54_05380 [Actinobacteria bacterium]|nr:hypothetical protein [Actinomycetota bacterium]